MSLCLSVKELLVYSSFYVGAMWVVTLSLPAV